MCIRDSFNIMLPDIVILILLSLLLFYLSIQALTNGCKTYKKENKAREAAQQAQANPDLSLKKKTTNPLRGFPATGNRYSKESNFSKQTKSKLTEN